jgi:hypothetical protein
LLAALASPASHGRIADAATKMARVAPFPMVKCYLSLRLDIALIFATMPRLNIPGNH